MVWRSTGAGAADRAEPIPFPTGVSGRTQNQRLVCDFWGRGGPARWAGSLAQKRRRRFHLTTEPRQDKCSFLFIRPAFPQHFLFSLSRLGLSLLLLVMVPRLEREVRSRAVWTRQLASGEHPRRRRPRALSVSQVQAELRYGGRSEHVGRRRLAGFRFHQRIPVAMVDDHVRFRCVSIAIEEYSVSLTLIGPVS